MKYPKIDLPLYRNGIETICDAVFCGGICCKECRFFVKDLTGNTECLIEEMRIIGDKVDQKRTRKEKRVNDPN